MKRLRDVEEPLTRFFGSGVYDLRHKLGPILWQLPPTLPCRTCCAWADRIRGWTDEGLDAYAFDNDMKVRAPFDALGLTARLAGGRPRSARRR